MGFHQSKATPRKAAEEVQQREHFRTCQRIGRAPIAQAAVGFALVVGSSGRDLAAGPSGLSAGPAISGAGHGAGASAEWASPSAIRHADSGTNPAVGSADCAVPGFTR